MALIYDLMTASNVKGYWNGVQLNSDTTLGEKVFPERKQLGLKLSLVKGASGLPVVLRASAFDTKATLRDRMNITIDDAEMPFFKEKMVVKETDRQQLNTIAQTGNQTLIDTIANGLFDDSATLLAGAKARLEAMRMQVLATGKLKVVSNGVAMDYDYGVDDAHKGSVTNNWSDPATATPLEDIQKAIDALEDAGGSAELMILNSQTFAQLRNAKSTLLAIKPTAPDGSGVKKSDLEDYLMAELGLTVVLKNEKYKDDDGVTKKFYPDGYVTFAPNRSLGGTVFGTTPEESDLMGGNITDANVEIFGTGIAITTTKLTDPVNVETKVSMIAMPSFEGLSDVYMLSTVKAV